MPVFLLFLSFLGFLGFALLLYAFKFGGVTDSWYGFPTRVAFVLLLTLAAAPFFLTIYKRVPALYLALPVILIFFLYRILSPSGLPYSQDPVFNLQFAQAILTSGSWHPLAGVTGQAGTYSYFPGGAVFNAEAASLTSLTLFQTFPWAYSLLRLLIVPLAVYALSARLFGPRPAALAVLFYISVPSFEFNIPTQQDFAVTFFVLAFAALAFLATENSLSSNLTMLRVGVIVAVAMVVISHHVSTYILLAFLGLLAVLPWILHRKDPYPTMRSLAVFFGALATAIVWVAAVSLPVLEAQKDLLANNLNDLVHPSQAPASAALLGATFPLYQVGWIVLSVVLVGLFAILVLAESYPRPERAFVTFSVLAALVVAVLSIPFFSTGFNVLILREFEYTGIILAPAAAWWVTTRLVGGTEGLSPQPTPTSNPRAAPRRVWVSRTHGSTRNIGFAIVAVVVIAVVFAGGSLVPLSSRDQFAAASALSIDSPVHINQTVYGALTWAEAHLSKDHPIWGDYLAYTLFGGFGGFKLRYDSFILFNGTGFSSIAVASLHTNDYVFLDRFMTTTTVQPVFYGPTTDQPNGTISPAELAKFSENPVSFALLYSDSTFTIYQYTGIQPAIG